MRMVRRARRHARSASSSRPDLGRAHSCGAVRPTLMRGDRCGVCKGSSCGAAVSAHSARRVRTKRSAIACFRCSNRGLDDLDALAGEDSVEVAGVLAIAVADQEPEPGRLLLEYWRACWLTHERFAVQPTRWTRWLASSMKKSTSSRGSWQGRSFVCSVTTRPSHDRPNADCLRPPRLDDIRSRAARLSLFSSDVSGG